MNQKAIAAENDAASQTLNVFNKHYEQNTIHDLTEYMRVNLSMQDIRTDQVKSLYDKCISLHQSSVSRKGKALENAVAHLLDVHKIPYLPQACVDSAGKITRPLKGHHRHDFIVNAKIGDSYQDKIIISCKTSLRERFLQDAHVSCKKMFMITMDPKALTKVDLLLKEHNISVVLIEEKEGAPLNEMLLYIKANMA